MVAIDVFLSYWYQDEDLRQGLDAPLAALRQAGQIDRVHLRPIDARWQPDAAPDERLEGASLVLFLVSSSFISCRYPWSTEATRALQRQADGDAILVPILLRPCQWQSTPLAELPPLPVDGRPITLWPDPAAAFASITEGLQRLLARRRLSAATQPVYRNDATRRWSIELEEAHQLRAQALAQGDATQSADDLIARLKAELRAGGELQAGDILAHRYQLLEAIGDGELHLTWRGRDLALQRLVLVRTLRPQFRRDLYRQELFFRSPQAMDRLKGVDGIVEVIEAHGEDDEVMFYVEEFLAGGDFRQRILEDQPSLNDRLEILLEVGEAIHEAHRVGVIHGDVQPRFLLFDLEGQPKVGGFARLNPVQANRTGERGQDRFLHVAPEAMTHGDAGPPADVYGLGMTSLFALHGQDMTSALTQNLPELMASLPVPAACLPVIERALAWKAEDRWPTLREYCGALHQAFIPVHGEPQPAARGTEAPDDKKQEPKTPSVVVPQGSPGKPEGISFRAAAADGNSTTLMGWLLRLAALTAVIVLAVAVFSPNGPPDAAPDMATQEAVDEGPTETRDCAALARAKGIDMLFVEGGSFSLGTDTALPVYGSHPTAALRSQPQHTVQLSPFWISVYAITNEQYDRFVQETDHQRAKFRDDASFSAPRQPVVGVSWRDATDFAEWAGMQLPTEAQWEAVARGPSGFAYPWGDNPPTPSVANYGNTRLDTVDAHPDGTGPYGTVGQAGGVWEWCRDTWNERAYVDRDGAVDPLSEYGSASRRVARGGSWMNDADSLHAAVRIQFGALNKHRNDVGFRVVCHPEGSP